MTVQRSERVVRTLADADPEFGELCKMLYGDVVDPHAIWQDVYGIAKADKKSPLERGVGALGLGATAVGTGYGVRELAEKLPQAAPRTAPAVHRVLGAGKKLVPTGVARTLAKPKVAAGIAGGMLAGDAAATLTLERNRRQQPVDKALVSMSALKTGTLNSMRATVGRLVPAKAGGKITGAMPTAAKPLGAMAQQGAKNAGSAVGSAAGAVAANPGKTAAAVGGVAVGGAAVTRARRTIPGQAPDPTMSYAKADGSLTWSGEFTKFDDDKRLAFGWASIVERDGLPVVDRQGDLIDPEEIEKAAYDYVLKSRVGGDMHRRTAEDRAHHVSDLVESFVVTREKVEKMGLPKDTPLGWWVGFKVHDDDTWAQVKKGGRTGFSIHGRGKRVEKTLDEVMGA